MIAVEVHRVRRGTYSADITKWLESVEWRESIGPPWGMIRLRFKAGLGEVAISDVPDSGDWIVIRREPGGPAVSWGRVIKVGSTFVTGHRMERAVEPFDIVAESWMDFLQSVQIYAGPGVTREVGTLRGNEGYSKLFSAISESVRDDVGAGLAPLLKELARVYLPTTLTGGPDSAPLYLGDAIKVARDAVTNGEFAPERVIEQVPGPSLLSMGSLTSAFQGSTALGMIQSAFGADPGMVEMFPSLEPATGAGEYSLSGLGAVPVLVYRMRPWREEPLQSYANRLPRGVGAYVRPGLFSAKTWDASRAHRLSHGKVTSVDFSFNDRDSVNAASCTPAGLNDSALRYYEAAGLPIKADKQIEDVGLRLYDVNWPFFPPLDDGESVDRFSWLQYCATLAIQAFQWHVNGDRFATGSAVGELDLDMRAGEVVSIEVPDALVLRQGTPGRPELEVTGETDWIAYAEEVSHVVRLGERKDKVKRTTVQFTRGVATERARTYPFRPYEVSDE